MYESVHSFSWLASSAIHDFSNRWESNACHAALMERAVVAVSPLQYHLNI